MPSLANLMEDYRNWRGRQDWEQGKGWQDFFGGDPRAQEQLEKLSGFGTDAGGLVGMIKAYHGSPHAFERFDMSKIGSGEGAQAYGHGLYFAENPAVASEYQQALSRQEGLTAKIGGKSITDFYDSIQRKADRLPHDQAASEYEKLSFLEDLDQQPTFQDALKRIDDESIVPWAKALESKYQPAGSFYNVELKWPDAAREAADPLGEHHLLDWFEPLSKQSESVKQAMRDYATLSGKEHYVQPETQLPVYIDEGISPDTTGKQFYDWLASHSRDIKGVASRQNASSDLKAFGIPGIKYLDEGSRSAGKGSRNYVMFDDQFPNIVSRNGVSLSDLLKR